MTIRPWPLAVAGWIGTWSLERARHMEHRSVKCVTIVAFLVLLCSTYYLRSEILKLNQIRFSSEDARAEETLKELKDSYPVRVAEYEAQEKNYELQMAHYTEMLDLYRTDYDEYVRRLADRYEPPRVPMKPQKPRSPELSEQLAKNNADFRTQQYHYFESAIGLNWISCIAALTLTAGLLFLIMFETGTQRIFYAVILTISFVFMIGPSFHSIMSAIAGLLRAPSVY